jgi:two-component system nitrate/nitrite response regulator NarL
MNQGTLRVVLVEDHALVRSAVRQAISAPDIVVVAEAATAEEALEAAARTRPDVILLDINLPGVNGIALLRDLVPRFPETKVVMLTVSAEERDVIDAIRNGAAGYLTKDLAPEALQRAVRGIRHGDLPMPRRLAAMALRHFAEGRGQGRENGGAAAADLSAREMEVLRLLAAGMTDRGIGEVLTISTRTVETHVSAILRKLGVRTRAEAAQIYRNQTSGSERRG